MFMTVDKSYKEIMRKVNKVPLAMRAGTQPGKHNKSYIDLIYSTIFWMLFFFVSFIIQLTKPWILVKLQDS